jgi:ribonuclease HI
MKGVTIFTDGSCIGNPGPGGWACILRYGQRERVLQGGETKTTNNRMELLAAIRGLQVLTETCKVTVITDSLYLQQGMTMYLQRWRCRNWLNSRGETILTVICGNNWSRRRGGTRRFGAGSGVMDQIQIRTGVTYWRNSAPGR